MTGKVVILGGGVAGLSAAHELLERGFQVEVIEKLRFPGGKARSIPVLAGMGDHGGKDAHVEAVRAAVAADPLVQAALAARRAWLSVLPELLPPHHRHACPHSLWRGHRGGQSRGYDAGPDRDL